MAGTLNAKVDNGSDMEIWEHAIEGAINAACIEILRFLGHEPSYENLHRHSRDIVIPKK